MRIKVDLASNALYFRISDAPIADSEEVHANLIIDYGEEGHVIGLEILHIKEQFKLEDLTGLKLEIPTIVDTTKA